MELSAPTPSQPKSQTQPKVTPTPPPIHPVTTTTREPIMTDVVKRSVVSVSVIGCGGKLAA